MTRRKVTMLEAFQDSARTTQERRDAALSRNQAATGDRALSADDPLAAEEHAEPRPAPSVHDGPAIVPVGESSAGGQAPGGEGEVAVADEATSSKAHGGLTLPFSGYGFAALQVLLLAGAFLLGGQFEEHGFGLRANQAAETSGQARLEAASFGMPGRSQASRQNPGSGAADARTTDAASGPVAGTVAGQAPGERLESGSPGEASMGSASGSPGALRGETSAGLTASDPDTAADRAFWDPAMRFTVLAINYTRSPANEALAWDTYDLLSELGFPAVKPVSRGMRIFLHVGAAASIDELTDLRDELQNLRVGPRQTPDFRTAYVVNINRKAD